MHRHLVVVSRLDLAAALPVPHMVRRRAVEPPERVEVGGEEDVGLAPRHVQGVVVNVDAVHLGGSMASQVRVNALPV